MGIIKTINILFFNNLVNSKTIISQSPKYKVKTSQIFSLDNPLVCVELCSCSSTFSLKVCQTESISE